MGRDSDSGNALILLGIIIVAIIVGASPKGCATSQPSPDVVLLPKPPFDIHSNATNDLLDPDFRSMVQASAENTTVYLAHDTVVGYIDKTQEWKNLTLRYMQDAPEWVKTGFTEYISAQLVLFQARALASGNATQAAEVLADQASTVSGIGLATVDFVSFNGATALRTYLETGNATKALCTTYPSQLGMLWHEAFDPHLSKAQRAHYLGQALAITLVTVALAGADGFSPKFKLALDKVGLADSWVTVKPYLGKIGSVISEKASYLTMTLVEKVAQRFPGSPTWEAGFVSDRVDAMAVVLHEKGLSNDAIEQRIQNLVQTVGDSSSSDDSAFKADVVSYNEAGGIKVKVGSENRINLYTNKDTMQIIKTQFLEDEVPGFKQGVATSLKVTYLDKGVTFYHYYSGGANWEPTAPSEFWKQGDEVTIHIEVLTRDDFMKTLPRPNLTNDAGLRWLSSSAEIKGYSLDGDHLQISVGQTPSMEGVSDFVIDGTAKQSLGFGKGITWLDFTVTDAFGQPRAMRINYDGYDPMYMGLFSAPDYSPVLLLSSDGVRLRIVEDAGGSQTAVATIYLKEPSILYSLGDMQEGGLGFTVDGASKVHQINRVDFQRQLEKSIRTDGSAYDVGRLGSEIAYTVAQEKLGLKGLVLEEPAKGGRDLHTIDGKVSIQARLIRETQGLTEKALSDELASQLGQMTANLKYDFENYPSTQVGYAILSYVDNTNVIKTIIVEVLPPVLPP